MSRLRTSRIRSRRRALVAGFAMTGLLTLLTMVMADQSEAAFPGFNGKIAFADGGIWVMEPDGSSPTEVAPYSRLADPAFSPDGTKIAFQSWRDDVDWWDIFVMSAFGASETNLTGPNGVDDKEPAFSPDGTK